MKHFFRDVSLTKQFMRLIQQTRLHFREGNSDKIYEVDLCELNGLYLVNFRYGKRGAELKEGTKTPAPVSQTEAEKAYKKLIDEKARKGYQTLAAGETEVAAKPKIQKVFDDAERRAYIVARLSEAVAGSKKKHKWPLDRVIWRAGELKIAEAAPHLVKLIGTGNALRDYCCAWALGWCGDQTVINALINLAETSGEATRRIAVEAVFKLSTPEKQRELQEKSIELLPTDLQILAQSVVPEDFERALRAFLEKPTKTSHTVLEQVYQVDNPVVRPALINLLGEIPLKPKYFKPLRQIFKRAEYRHDAEVFGVVARRFEISKSNFVSNSYWDSIYFYDAETGQYQSVKRSEELASETSRYAYSDRTRNYFLRRTWRTLRTLGADQNTDYVKMAVGALLQYSDADAQEPRSSIFYSYRDENGNWDWRNPKTLTVAWDKFAPYLLFNHILYENSLRYEFKRGSHAFRCRENYKPGDPAPTAREEAFPKLWEEQPVGLLHLLSESECTPVHEFAVKALRDCQEFLDTIETDAILMLLERPYEVTAELGFELARGRYDSANPNVDLVIAVAVCSNAEARAAARNWIEANRELFARNSAAIIRLLTANFADTREFAGRLLQTTNYTDSEANVLIGRLFAEIISFDHTKIEQAESLGAAILQSFGKRLSKLNLEIVLDLLKHPLVAVQELGGNILLEHETRVDQIPNEVITLLIESEFETMRAIGIKLFGQLPDENLLHRENVIIALLMHKLTDVHFSIRPVLQKLANNHPDFVGRMTRQIIVALVQPEKHESIHSRLLTSLREDLSGWQQTVDLETTRMLIKADSPQAQEAGGLVLVKRSLEWHEEISTEEIIDLSNHEVLAVREASWQTATAAKNRFSVGANEYFSSEVNLLVRALDAKWNDSQTFWFEFFKTNLTAEELTPAVLVAIADSVKGPVQKFGRDLLQQYFRAENGLEYLLKLSEHPAANMQLFATNYLEMHASDAPERIRQLAPYFVRVLSLVNRARTAKTRVLSFLEREGLKNVETAQTVAKILARQSATMAIGDRAAMIETMLKIRHKFPEITLPITIKKTEVRVNAR